MRVCLLTDKPEHPLIAALPDLLGAQHHVVVVDPHAEGRCATSVPPADLYVLKAHSPQAVQLARQAESQGGQVVNNATSTEFCQDRVAMADRALAEGMPFPDTYSLARLSELSAGPAGPSAPDFPLIVKSRVSRRGDLVTRLDGRDGLRSLAAEWSDEPVVVQGVIANDGWDYKLYVIGTRVFAGLRRSPLDGQVGTATYPRDPDRLPPGWLDLARAVGESFGLQIYGVDILATAQGPVIVDINPFPGCRGVPGAPEALAAFVLQAGRAPGASRSGAPWSGGHTGQDAGPFQDAGSAQEALRQGGRPTSGESAAAALHDVVREVFAAFAGPGEGAGDVGEGDRVPPGLRVVSVRRKPGRGLTVSYRTGPSAGALVTARVAEPVVGDPGAGKLIASATLADFQGRWPGILRCRRIGLTVQCFPDDAELPALAAAVGTSALDGDLAAALTDGARTVLGAPGAELAEVLVSPVRYKPGDRCVLRYQVRLTTQDELVFFGKLYRDSLQAAETYRLAEQLWAVRDRTGPHHRPAATTLAFVPPAVPRPLALVADLALVITEAAGGAHGGGTAGGTVLLRPPRRLRAAVAPPEEALAAAAAALAWMHTSGVTAERRVRSGSDNTDRVRRWTRTLCETVPGISEKLDRTVGPLIDALEALGRDGTGESVLVHGAFKPSQLVFCTARHPVITDLDGAGLGDPAADVGCFLAYLRPSGVMRGRPGSGDWYAKARKAFLDAYLAGLASPAVAPVHLAGLRRRAALFDAALLLKIASRRVRRLSSPRSEELQAVVCEIDRCLELFTEESAAEGEL
jgi:aminoglycoside phosphotransferase (APT) family kinase protein